MVTPQQMNTYNPPLLPPNNLFQTHLCKALAAKEEPHSHCFPNNYSLFLSVCAVDANHCSLLGGMKSF